MPQIICVLGEIQGSCIEEGGINGRRRKRSNCCYNEMY